MAGKTGNRLRCAIYTRKSSEEGLEQDFNSLHAQREACEAYIKSQAGEGWQLIRTHYDDGGISGGTLERPGLKQLLADIKARKVDTVVVYKVDRLTRSLADFAKIVEVFDGHRVSFVSITQQFNTTTSMGRLTLNMLLSFAQFEREVTGERIRDKIAASKRKGMWMGGFVPLGYDAKDRSLIINEAEAKTVRALFRLYLARGSVRRVKEEADRLDLKSKLRTTQKGRMRGGRPLSRGYIYKLLGNPLYAGRITHKSETYPGQHDAIIDPKTWEAVQTTLTSNTQNRQAGTNAAEPSLLAGLLYDNRGNRLSPSHAVKNGKRYRYYVSQALLQDRDHAAGAVTRIPAREIEDLVISKLRTFLMDPAGLIDGLTEPDATPRDQHRLLTAAREVPTSWAPGSPKTIASFVRQVLERVTLGEYEIDIQISKKGLKAALLGGPPAGQAAAPDQRVLESDVLVLKLPARLKRCSGEMRLVIPAGVQPDLRPRPNAALIKALSRAHTWKEILLSGQAVSIRAIAKEEGVTESYLGRLLRLAFLAPDITEAILEGSQPPVLELDRLLKDIPLAWADQRRLFGFESVA